MKKKYWYWRLALVRLRNAARECTYGDGTYADSYLGWHACSERQSI